MPKVRLEDSFGAYAEVALLDTDGDVVDGAGNKVTGGGSVSLENIPAGSTITVSRVDGEWPARPTDRSDVIVQWKGPDPSPDVVESGTAGMLDGVDIRFITEA